LDTGNDEPPELDETIFNVLQSLGAPTLHMQATRHLPFLLRTVRRGFTHRCAIVGVPSTPSPPPKVVKVVFRLDGHSASLGRMLSWKCPICELHGEFVNKVMLGKHLEWDHDVRVTWEGTDEVRLVSVFTMNQDLG
jgi:hypothetical protein